MVKTIISNSSEQTKRWIPLPQDYSIKQKQRDCAIFHVDIFLDFICRYLIVIIAVLYFLIIILAQELIFLLPIWLTINPDPKKSKRQCNIDNAIKKDCSSQITQYNTGNNDTCSLKKTI